MTREDVKKIFPNATDEEITAMLNAHHADIPKPAIKDDELTALKEKAKKLDAYEADKLSNEEKVAKALAEAEQLKMANAKMLNKTKATAELVKAGFTSEEIEKFVGTLVTDDEESTLANVKSIVDVYSEKTKTLVEQTKKDFVNGTPKPQDKGGNTPPQPKTEAEKLVESISVASAENAKASKSALDYYTGG